MVITRTLGGGEIAFLADHAPFLGALAENHTRIFLVDGTVRDIAVHGGFVEVSGNKVSILSDVAELADEIDSSAPGPPRNGPRTQSATRTTPRRSPPWPPSAAPTPASAPPASPSPDPATCLPQTARQFI